jgi:hypothetical protein
VIFAVVTVGAVGGGKGYSKERLKGIDGAVEKERLVEAGERELICYRETS